MGYQMGFGFIILGAIFDFFDGFTARLLHVSSEIGKELDSLADCITFGFAPATIAGTLINKCVTCWENPLILIVPFLALLMAAFSALRLAKFNLDTRQTTSFLGMPTPANALFWGSIGVWVANHPDAQAYIEGSVPVCIGLILAVFFCCWLLVSEIPMFALKFKHYGWKGNEMTYSFVIFSAIVLVFLQFSAFAVIIPLYVILSVLTQKKA